MTTTIQPSVKPSLAAPEHLDQAHSTPDTSINPEEFLQRIDDTLGLIAEANQIASGWTPVKQIDVSVIVPIHNCRDTIPEVIDRIDEVMPPATETILIDDGSVDGSWHYLRGLPQRDNRIILRRRHHHGRGSAIRMGLRHTQGHVVAIQDADMAYDPADLLGAIWPILEEQAEVVYGSRSMRRGGSHRNNLRGGLGNQMGRLVNRCLTTCSNLTTGLHLSDLETGHKVFLGDLIRSLPLSETGSGIDAEITAKVAKAASTIMEVPTHYTADLRAPEYSRNVRTAMTTLRSLFTHRNGN
ncbi:glycosyltransferase family 2 protein [Rhodopirellula sp. JC740]|uniref:Glycosyltransferase family 2 protein n=1 Tax=Rhodopirellula halodulae TaxID=2894198 RepID=A0ABS8NIY8_9BACT|nr:MULTISPECIES: glycosyltransferase family 2 protein [unclassified Rhodopirellula]MCC9643519.1 glycosyltransferase family 2 protein [Rhodopirellula sp. JC740]MCC9658089.1 glycosyltransferase family 2 protein [Rhodopirellula sp. JC737]